MKTLLLLITLLSSLSCSTDNTECGYTTSTFIGKWKLLKVLKKIDGADVTNEYLVSNPCERNLIWEFKSDQKLSRTNSDRNCTNMKDVLWSISKNGSNYFISYSDPSAGALGMELILDINCQGFKRAIEFSDYRFEYKKL